MAGIRRISELPREYDLPTFQNIKRDIDANFTALASGQGLSDSSVTYDKIQNVSATDKVLGRSSAGSGIVEEIACTAAGRALIDDANAAAQLTTLGFSTYGKTLIDDADAATARATLGLGDMATKNASATLTIGTAAQITANATIGAYETAVQVSLLTNGVATISVTGGGLYILTDNSGGQALYMVNNDLVTVPTLIAQSGPTTWTVTKDTASDYNVYVEGSALKLQNKTAGTRAFYIAKLGR